MESFWNRFPKMYPGGFYLKKEKKSYNEIDPGDIEIIESIGTGSYGSVFRGKWKKEGEVRDVAIKKLLFRVRKWHKWPKLDHLRIFFIFYCFLLFLLF